MKRGDRGREERGMDLDVEKVKRHLKAVFVHTQAAFCDKSLGTKIHLDVLNANNPIFLEGERHTICHSCGMTKKFHDKNKEILSNDKEGTHLMVYALMGGGGMAYVGAICSGGYNTRLSLTGFDGSPMGVANVLRYVCW